VGECRLQLVKRLLGLDGPGEAAQGAKASP
jgi:hypothetical protein